MTDEESDAMIRLRRGVEDMQRELRDVRNRVNSSGDKTDKIFKDLYEVPEGSSAGAKSFMQTAKDAHSTIDRISWLTRIMPWVIGILTAISVSARAVWRWITNGGGG